MGSSGGYNIPMKYSAQIDRLLEYLRSLDSVVLALSGGLDSVLLAKAVSLSGIRAVAVTGRSATTPRRDLQDAISYTGQFGMEHRVLASGEMERDEFTSNPPERCYYCKDTLFSMLDNIRQAEGYACVIDGGNRDDLEDYRPGRKAAKAHGVRSPLMECGFSKLDVRMAARKLELPISSKPSSPCLSSRFAYGVRITQEGLLRVARAEDYVRELLGVEELRVRDLGGRASVEVAHEHIAMLDRLSAHMRSRLLGLGFSDVVIDAEGFRSGKLNEALGDD